MSDHGQPQESDDDAAMQQACAYHAERAGTLAMEFPSHGQRTYLCGECRADLENTLANIAHQPEPWEKVSDHRIGGGGITYTRTSVGWQTTERPTGMEKK